WCRRAGEIRSDAMIEAAAADALGVMYRRRAPMAADDRARSLRMRARSYRALRNVALRMYRRRFVEEPEAYQRARQTAIVASAQGCASAQVGGSTQPYANSGCGASRLPKPAVTQPVMATACHPHGVRIESGHAPGTLGPA